MEKTKGILYIILSASAFGIMPILAKLSYKGGANAYSTLFLRFLFAAIMLFYYLKTKGISMKLTKKQSILILVIGVFGFTLTTSSLYMSYNYIGIGMASMIFYIYPSIVTILAYMFYKEKIYSRKIISLIISLMGIYILIDKASVSFNIKGIILALIAAVLYSLYVLGASNKEFKNINSYVLTFYISCASATVMFIAAISTNNFSIHISFYALVAILLIAFISTVVALMAFLEGVRLIGPSKASILSTIEPIVSLILGIIILGEAISSRIIIGSIMIVLSVVILTKK
ncbi:DMT family transporter [Clostridium estertheticum]|uniref:DMT family transporter n=1 Tax=Clostridium estertheticum TaxID=238834 RepID=A0A7Y3WS09_9CLOT|nr:DMT family transporter [Clostridium estertheticum]MBW9171032.1 DMT family transporter [Clostridium estertheticum]MBX4265982.1 DMT family transporter [Clostridium estertheticum]MBX4268719.1 DMT family transporter [Clostridium estertheticum]NNU76527.1 DMT family transporter [Clostridium estertheticum]WBL46015.1 DMT family transporter [Clostridium estertheticum]